MQSAEYDPHENVPIPPVDYEDQQSELTHGEELLEQVDHGTYKFGTSTIPTRQLFTNIRERVDEQQRGNLPRKPFIIIAAGNPLRGKTTILRQGMHHVFNGKTADEIEERTGTRPVDIPRAVNLDVTWGDVFYLLDPSVLFEESYFGDPEATERKRLELEKANQIYGAHLTSAIQTANQMIENGDERPIFVTSDVPLQTGIRMRVKHPLGQTSDTTIGMIRGLDAVRDIAHFRNKSRKLLYEDFYIGAYASKEVFDAGLNNRQVISENSSLEDIIRELRQNGTFINLEDPEELKRFLDKRQSARPDEVMQTEQDGHTVIEYLKAQQLLEQKRPASFQEFLDSRTLFQYENALVMRWLLTRYLNLPPEKVALAANQKRLSTIHLDEPEVEMEYHQPIWEDLHTS